MSNSEAAKEKGGLVWVKRRNGTWWPDPIVYIKDVPESCFASKGLGAPVKLLGIEDVTIEWFKIEKSKRIKAFRCPESVEWLKRGNPSAVNSDQAAIYAKRKDAISQTLRIEAEHTNSSDMPISGAKEDEPERLPGDTEGDIDDIEESSVELTAQGSGRVSPNGRSKGVQRTRLLEDFGLGIPSKRRRIPTQRASEYLKTKNRCSNICSDMPISAAKKDESERIPGDHKKVDQLSHSGASSENADSMVLTPQASGQGSPNGRSKGVQRTRPLEDFGLGIPSKRRRIPTQKASEYLKTKESASKSSEAPPNLPIVRENLVGIMIISVNKFQLILCLRQYIH